MTVRGLQRLMATVETFNYMNAWTEAHIRLNERGELVSGGEVIPVTMADLLDSHVRQIDIDWDANEVTVWVEV